MRRVVETNNRIRSGEQLPSIDALSIGLRGKTVGLVGMGSIAYEAATLFAAFQCPIIVYAPTSPPERWNVPSEQYPTPVAHTRAASLDELLQTADVVSLHCPLTASTRNMIGARELALMKTESVLINTSRGGMIDEDALAVALSTGQIYGAGLDVMAHEPAFGANLGALRDLPNVVILPHLGGSTEATTEMGCNEAIDIVRDYLDGKGARNRVA
jgi:phosphoglycerate dehydrogenase-like enzyme